MLFRKWRGARGFWRPDPGRDAETRPVSRSPRPILSTMDTPVGQGRRPPVATPFCAGPDSPVNIDYSNILPGDDAPEPVDPAVPAKKEAPPPAQAAARPANTGATGTHAALGATGTHAALTSATGTHAALPRSSGANVVVLSADPTLIDLLRDAVAGHHRVWRADDITHAADLMVASGNAVLLIDAALADHDTKSMVTQVHKQFPELAIMLAR